MSEDTKFFYTADWEMIRTLIDTFIHQGEDKRNLLLQIAMAQGNAVHSAVGIVESTTGLHAIVGISCPKCGLEHGQLKGGPELGRNYGECLDCGSFLFDIVPQSIPWQLIEDATRANEIMLQQDELADFQENSVYSKSRARRWLARVLGQ